MTQTIDPVQEKINSLKAKAKKRFDLQSERSIQGATIQDKSLKLKEFSGKNICNNDNVSLQDQASASSEIVPFPRNKKVPSECWSMSPAIVRSPVFGVVKKGTRNFLRNQIVASYSDTTITYSGEALSQSDMDVYLQAVKLSRDAGLGSQVKFTKGEFLRKLKRKKSSASYNWLVESIKRLQFNNISIKHNKMNYVGSLIDSMIFDDNSGEISIKFNPDIASLFSLQTYVSIEDRLSLGTSELAKWLHLYILSQSGKHVISCEKLMKLSGSSCMLKKFNENLRKSIRKIQDKIPHLILSWSIKNNLFEFTKQSQLKLPAQGPMGEIAGANG